MHTQPFYMLIKIKNFPMKLSRCAAIVALSVCALVFMSCSGISKVATQKSSVYPEWYNANQPFTPSKVGYKANATALAADSSAAAQKALTHAEEELKSGISERLEAIRKEAADELGNSSGLNTPGFVVTLRKAETNIIHALKKANMEIDPNETYSGYRAFAEAAVDKKALIRELDEAMERYKTAWNAMKTSQAFSKF